MAIRNTSKGARRAVGIFPPMKSGTLRRRYHVEPNETPERANWKVTAVEEYRALSTQRKKNVPLRDQPWFFLRKKYGPGAYSVLNELGALPQSMLSREIEFLHEITTWSRSKIEDKARQNLKSIYP